MIRRAERLIRWLVPDDQAEMILGDLAEASRRYGPVRRWAWYCVQALVFALVHGMLGLKRIVTRSRRPDRPRTRVFTGLRHDLRFALRSAFARPGFSATIVFTLALGIGANTAMFAILDAVLLRPLPYAEPDRLFLVDNETESGRSPNTSEPDFLDFRQYGNDVIEFAAVTGTGRTLTGDGAPERLNAGLASANLFPLLGATTVVGRAITAAEDAPNGPDVTVLTHEFWRSRFGGDSTIVGSRIVLDGRAHTVVGVLDPSFRLRVPSSFRMTPRFDLWVPLHAAPGRNPRSGRYLTVLARLDASATFAQAHGEADRIGAEIRRTVPTHAEAGYRPVLVPLADELLRDARGRLWTLMGAVALVLLIAAANVSNMMLARAAGQRREWAVRNALGASRTRIVRQALVDAVVLAASGAVAGSLLAVAVLQWGLQYLPSDVPRLDAIQMNWRVFGFAGIISAGACVIFGVLPALRVSRININEVLADTARESESRRGRWAQRGLVVLEVSLAVMLFVGAGLMLRTFVALAKIDPGFDPETTITFRVGVPQSNDLTHAVIVRFFDDLLPRLEAIPGVTAVGGTSAIPLSGRGTRINFTTDNWVTEIETDHRIVTPGYLDAMGGRLVAGRWFEPADGRTDRYVAIVDEELAARAWPDLSPIGRQLDLFDVLQTRPTFQMGRRSVEVIGVIEHLQHHELGQNEGPTVFLPHPQTPWEELSMVMRGDGVENQLGAIRNAVATVAPTIAMTEVRSLENYVDGALRPTGFLMGLLVAMAALAGTLVLTGVYGVLSFFTALRMREVGLRMALGARGGDVVRMIVRDGMLMVGAGIAIGTAGAIAFQGVLANWVYGVSPEDPSTFVVCAVALLLVGTVASVIPAWRAASASPLTVMRPSPTR